MTQNGQYKSLSQQAYEQIKYKIVSLKLAPGSVIDETQLRNELDLGRTPIREALQRLALEKLVIIVPRRGMFVTEISLTDLPRIFELRLVLEPMATRLAVQRGNSNHWERMSQLFETVSTDPDELITLDQQCHEIIYEAAGNEFLQDALQTLYVLSLRLWYYALSRVDDMQSAVLEHKAILVAIEMGDASYAAQLMERHIRAFQEEIQAVMLA